MAKGQKRSNRELKKPKQSKAPAAPATSNLAGKGSAATSPFKKKG